MRRECCERAEDRASPGLTEVPLERHPAGLREEQAPRHQPPAPPAQDREVERRRACGIGLGRLLGEA